MIGVCLRPYGHMINMTADQPPMKGRPCTEMIGRIGRGLADHSNVESTDPYGANDLRHHFVGEAAAQPGEPDDVHTTVAGDDTDVDGVTRAGDVSGASTWAGAPRPNVR